MVIAWVYTGKAVFFFAFFVVVCVCVFFNDLVPFSRLQENETGRKSCILLLQMQAICAFAFLVDIITI